MLMLCRLDKQMPGGVLGRCGDLLGVTTQNRPETKQWEKFFFVVFLNPE